MPLPPLQQPSAPKLLPSEWLWKMFVREAAGGGWGGVGGRADSLREGEARHMVKAWRNFLPEKKGWAHIANCPRPGKPGKERRKDTGLQQGGGSF